MGYHDADDIINREPCRDCPDDFGCAFTSEPLCAHDDDDDDEDWSEEDYAMSHPLAPPSLAELARMAEEVPY